MLPVLFGFTLFFSSALLFLVQPMIGRTLLPHLGGNPLAWSACLVFFQATLLAGYVYADSLHRFRGVRWQPILQTVLLLVAAALCLIGLAGDGMLRFLAPRLDLLDSWPVLNMLALLVVGIGFPFLVLAAVGPLVQRWFAQTAHPRASDPYFLFVASNLGGIAALVLYPLVVERFTPMWVQWLLWKIGLAALALLLLGLAVCVWRSRANPEFEPPAPSDDPNTPATPILVGRGPATWPRRIYWLIAAALPVALMMSVTDYLTLDVSPIPLFWAAPLGLYLIAFSQAFARCAPVANGGFVLKLILHILYGILFLGALVATVIAAMSRSLDFNGPDGVVFGFACLVTLTMLLMPSSWLRIVQPISVVIVVLTQANMVALMSQMSIINILLHLTCFYWSARLCLEGLAADRPAAPAVTAYFSWIGLGGLCGGLFQIVIAPYLFRDYLEYTFLAALACMLRPAWLTNGLTDWLLGLIVLPRAEPTAPPTRGRRLMALGFDLGLAFVVCVLAVGLFLLRMRHGNEGRPLGNTPRILVDWPLILALFIAVPLIARPIRFGLALAAIVAWCWIGKDLFGVETVVFRDRNLLGTVRVVEDKSSMRIIDPLPGEVVRDPMIHRRLMQGTTDQGGCIADPTALARYPTAYYHRKGPVGVVMRHLDMYSGPPQTNWSDVRIAAALVGQGVPLGVGNLPLNAIGCAWSEPPYAIVGLGAGTSFAYAHPYQWVDAYEIDPIVVKLSTRPTPLFHHFQAARKRGVAANIYQGDGRRLLSKQRNDGFYHVMFIDAMNSDAFPVHLFTEEAIQLYFQKLAPKGVLMVHASNRHVDLPPKLAGTAAKLGFASLAMRDHEPDRQRLEYSSHWVAIARNAETIERWTRHEPELDQRLEIQPINVRGLGWTDEHASVAASLHPRQGWFEFLLGVLIVLLAFGAVLGLVEMIIAMLPETPRSQTPFGNEGGERNFGYQQRGTQTYV